MRAFLPIVAVVLLAFLAAAIQHWHDKTKENTMTTTDETTETTEVLTAELLSRPRRTGVIVGLHPNVTNDMAVMIRDQLQLRYPHIVISCVPATSSVAFEWDEPDEDDDA